MRVAKVVGRRWSRALCPWGRNAALAVLLPAIAACSGGSSAPSDTVTFADPPVLASAVAEGAAPTSAVLSIVLGLERDSEGLVQRVRDIAKPGSPYYHRRQSVADTAAEFGARRETIDAMAADLRDRGLAARVDVTGMFLATEMTIAQATDVFGTAFATYSVPGRGSFVAPQGEPTAPAAWQGAVREVMGLSTQPSLDDVGDESGAAAPIASWSSGGTRHEAPAFTEVDQPGSPDASGTPGGCSEALAKRGFKPNELLAAYGLEALQAQGLLGQGIRMAVVEVSGFVQSDIDTFTGCYGIQNPVTPTIVLTGGNTAPLPVGDECTLDIEVALMVAPQLAGLYVVQGSKSSYAHRAQLYAAALDPSNTGGDQIDILSTSIGSCEASLTSGFVGLMEDLLKSAAAAGVSVFASAGDSGSSGCYRHAARTEELSASYPATSSYAVGVGGTNLQLDAQNQIAGSSVWNDLPWRDEDSAGGGGPSVFQEAPPWQSGTGTGASMRTTPDVAFYGDPLPGYTVYNSSNGGWYNDGGTSAATPFFAAATALLHQASLAATGQQPVVAYEWIYGIAASSSNDVFWDITLGDNDLFGVGCCTAGPGYDQASGWGSLDIGAASSILIATPEYRAAP